MACQEISHVEIETAPFVDAEPEVDSRAPGREPTL